MNSSLINDKFLKNIPDKAQMATKVTPQNIQHDDSGNDQSFSENFQKPAPSAFDFGEFIFLLKRFFTFNFKKKMFLCFLFISIAINAFIVWLLYTVLKQERKFYIDLLINNNKKPENMPYIFSKIHDLTDKNASKKALQTLFDEIMKLLIFMIPTLLIFVDSDVFNLKDKLSQEISSGFYSKSSLFIASFSYELIFNILLGILTFTPLLIIGDFRNVLALRDYMIIFITLVLYSAIKMLINAIMLLYFSNLKSSRILLISIKFGILFISDFFGIGFLLYELNWMLGIFIKYAFSFLIFLFNPTYLFFCSITLFNLNSLRHKLVETLNITELDELFNTDNLNSWGKFGIKDLCFNSPKLLLLLTALSFISIIYLSFTIFSKFFRLKTEVSSEQTEKKVEKIVNVLVCIITIFGILSFITFFGGKFKNSLSGFIENYQETSLE